ncbi:transcriptional regulator, putative [Candida dubliniensis CD36]|uniref:Transcriptional regulator, putative n=1 Tax=Candida dubliniensis (strain CD36 / ATCC MYA-646 / CBS 7987 / NCPF 3949 / NRRL Y-17841) TaxID=573826 RepID=B9WEF9_CANDC|nr:transcriptional regulator, putative [Candida dubliniensis CD36]CAX43071.1 transcriptional regulator, putative [Candida dubliniensis CD36]
MSDNPYPQDEGSQLYDNFDISPPSIVIRKADTDQSLNKIMLTQESQDINNYYTENTDNNKNSSNYEDYTFSGNSSNRQQNQQHMYEDMSTQFQYSNNSSFEPPPAPTVELTDDPLPNFNYPPSNIYINDNASDISLNTKDLPQFTTNEFLSPTSQLSTPFSPGHYSQSSQDFLQVNHTNSSNNNNLLNPRSPSQYSSHSLYSDNSSQPASPFLDAASHVSNNSFVPPVIPSALSDVGSQHLDPSNNLGVSVNQHFDSVNEFLSAGEIQLGQSVSSTNLPSMEDSMKWGGSGQEVYTSLAMMEQRVNTGNSGIELATHQFSEIQVKQDEQQQQQQQANINQQYSFSNPQMKFDFDITVTPPPQQQEVKSYGNDKDLNNSGSTNDNNNSQLDIVSTAATNNSNQLLTENNLSNYNQLNQQTRQSNDNDSLQIHRDASGIIISINQAPEEVAAKTPSLFSNSSANSSIHNSPRSDIDKGSQYHNNGDGNSLLPNSQLLPSSPNSNHDSYASGNDENNLLNPEEFQSVKRGRRKSHASRSSTNPHSVSPRSRSKSPNDASDNESEDVLQSREKMLELALPSSSSKRTQKHPSLYACHLCDKRFTRPYNLKSHIRTHTQEKPFICSKCGKSFARSHDKKRHELLHQGIKNFKCEGYLQDGTRWGCGKSFARADALRRHFQTEAGKQCVKRLLLEEQANSNGKPIATSSGVEIT